MKWKRGKKAQQEARLAQQQLKQQHQHSPGHALNQQTPVPLLLGHSGTAPAYQQQPRELQQVLGAALASAGNAGADGGVDHSSAAHERLSASPERHLERKHRHREREDEQEEEDDEENENGEDQEADRLDADEDTMADREEASQRAASVSDRCWRTDSQAHLQPPPSSSPGSHRPQSERVALAADGRQRQLFESNSLRMAKERTSDR